MDFQPFGLRNTIHGLPAWAEENEEDGRSVAVFGIFSCPAVPWVWQLEAHSGRPTSVGKYQTCRAQVEKFYLFRKHCMRRFSLVSRGRPLLNF